MKLLHTADWHIGKRLGTISRLPEQIEVLEEICALADEHEVDMVLVAGDLFDSFNPSVEAIETFYRYVKKLTNDGKRPVVAIAGNHDSPGRIESPDPLARECGILFLGYPDSHPGTFSIENKFEITHSEPGFFEIQLASHSAPVRILTTPYANQFRIRKFLDPENQIENLNQLLHENWQNIAQQRMDEKGINLLTTHLYAFAQDTEESIDEGDDERPILHAGGLEAVSCQLFPREVQYVALGHIHRPYTVQKEPLVVYPGSPIQYAFTDIVAQKRVVLVNIEPSQTPELQTLPLSKGKELKVLTFESMTDALLQIENYPDFLLEIHIHTSEYLRSEDINQLKKIHPGIIHIHPVIQQTDQDEQTNESGTIQNKSIQQLFEQYFEAKNGQPANDDFKTLFNEILNAQ